MTWARSYQLCARLIPLDEARRGRKDGAGSSNYPAVLVSLLLAHLSDPHVGPLVQPRFTELLGKRLTGYWNWKRHRHSIHHMGVLAKIIQDVRDQTPDHIALTGDLVNIGMRQEYPTAHQHLLPLGDPHLVSIVPGNHDAYVRSSLDMMRATFGHYMADDDGRVAFPYLRVRKGVALIGLSSAIPTAPFVAEGALGPAQLGQLEARLPHIRKSHAATVIMIHHPPHRGGAAVFRGLRDAAHFEQLLARHGADLVLHGHNHKRSIAYLKGPDGSQVPVVGVASASAVPGDPAHLAAYHLFRIQADGTRVHIDLDVRGMSAATGPVGRLESFTISRNGS